MKRHPLDLFSLLAGMLITAVAIASLTTGLDSDLVTSDVFWPVVLISLGLVALVATLGTSRAPEADEPDATPGSDLAPEVEDASTATGTSEPVES